MATKKEFKNHIHVFRGVAIILIVCAHTVPSLDWSSISFTGRVIDAIANESSIFFFFIAGYFIRLPQKILGRERRMIIGA